MMIDRLLTRYRNLNPLVQIVGFFVGVALSFSIPFFFIFFLYAMWKYNTSEETIRDESNFSVARSARVSWHASGLYGALSDAHLSLRNLGINSAEKSLQKALKHYGHLSLRWNMSDEDIWISLDDCGPDINKIVFAKDILDQTIGNTLNLKPNKSCTAEECGRKLGYFLRMFSDSPLPENSLDDLKI